MGGWVKPTSTKNVQQRLLTKSGSGHTNYQLTIDANSLTPRLSWGCTTPTVFVTGTSELIKDHWNQLLGTYDGANLRLYVNGAVAAQAQPATGTCTAPAAPLYVGGDPSAPAESLVGMLDDVVVYSRALPADEVYDLFVYQGSWVEDRQSRNLTVDAENPTAEVLLNAPAYMVKAASIVPIKTDDKTSGMASAKLCVGGTCANAPHCTDPGRTSLWCPTFTPPSAGSFLLTAQATDLVGHSATSPAVTALVDDSPPALIIGATDGTRLDARARPDDPSRWYVTLSGTVGDPAIPGTSIAGSGVPSDGVQVTIYEPDGGLAGSKDQTATLSGSTWSIDYDLSDKRPAGCYKVHMEAVDALARTPGLDATQVARHTASLDRTVGINASGPAVQVDRSPLVARKPSRTTPPSPAWPTRAPSPSGWSGRPAPAGQSRPDRHLFRPRLGESHTPYAAIAGAYNGGAAAYSWSDQVRRQADCTVHMTAAASTTGVVSGTVSVCGASVATWRDNTAADYTVSFRVNSSACEADTCSGQVASAGIGGVDLAFTPLQPGSTFVNETAPAGEVLHLPFDEGPDATPGIFRNVALGGLAATCAGSTCPSVGQPGPKGSAALFNPASEVNDVVQVGSFGTFTTTTVSAWVRRTGNTGSRETIVSYKEVEYLRLCARPQRGKQPVSQLLRALMQRYPWAYWASLSDPHEIPLDTWVHLAATWDGGKLRLYRDGQLVSRARISGSGAASPWSSVPPPPASAPATR